MKLNTGKPIVVLTALALSYSSSCAAWADDLFSPGAAASSPAKPAAETASILDSQPTASGEVTIWVRVPLDEKAVDSFSVFPYPVKPPPIKDPIKPLSNKPKTLKEQLLTAGYLRRVAHQSVCPPNGWRWQHAYETALRHSGGNLPKTIFGMYQWRNSMVQYIIPEVMRINQFEKDRKVRYDKAMQDNRRNYAEAENEATRNGLFPVEVRMGRAFRGQVSLAPGTWWISGSRRVPGLAYYWWLPITVTAGEKSQVMLTEDNALLVQGGW